LHPRATSAKPAGAIGVIFDFGCADENLRLGFGENFGTPRASGIGAISSAPNAATGAEPDAGESGQGKERDMGRLDGRVAIVTGAADGARAAIGAAYARALASEGAMVAVADVKDPDSVVADIRAARGKAIGVIADVSDEAQVTAMVDRTVSEFGRLDALVNNAAIGSNIPPIPVEEMSVEAWDALMAVNVRGPFLCVRAAVPVMRRQGYGKIINVGSATMFSGLPNRLHYVTAKGAIHAMTRALAVELGAYGIRVNTVAYGLISNPVTDAEFSENPGKRAAILGARALGDDVRTDDLIGMLVHLVSSESDAMTGQCVVIDGGDVFN
jgi:NAD(P)-dependent dehydrogenase (short-subunit alcohol dehydrogenase family)